MFLTFKLLITNNADSVINVKNIYKNIFYFCENYSRFVGKPYN